MAHLIVEIGNTALKAAWTEGGDSLGKTYRYQGEKPVDFIQGITAKEKPEVLTVASVAGISAADEKRLRGCCRQLLLLDEAHKSCLEGFGLPSYLTYDRAAAMVAARHMFVGKPCTVMDFGTTLNVDFIDAEGKYEGGNISPGCRTRFKALNRYSRALPLVDTPAEVSGTGHSIQESIENGVITGILFEIQGYLASHPDNVVIFTGGDAIYFVKKIKTSIFVVCNLVLMGLSLITETYVEKNFQ